MRRIILILILLTSCTTTYDWTGAYEKDLMLTYGAPTLSESLAMGGKALTFYNHGCTYVFLVNDDGLVTDQNVQCDLYGG